MTTVPPGRYRHYKGKEYTVLGVALHSETKEELVVYRQEYGEHGLWVRPKEMFLETVKVDGQDVPRFQHLGSEHQKSRENIKNLFGICRSICPKNSSVDMMDRLNQVMVVAPVNAQKNETEHIADELRDQRPQRFQSCTVRSGQFQNHDRDDDRDHSVTECLHSILTHRPILA